MTAFALLLAVQVADTRWAVLLACPKVSAPGISEGTGVVIGVKDGSAYLLTANHVAVSDRVAVQFTSQANYPKAAWFGEGATVIARWPDPDLALIRFPIVGQVPPVLPLAPPGSRPKPTAFPTAVVTVGVGSELASTAIADAIRGKEFVRRAGKGPAFFWRTELAPELGRSGGPLLDSQRRVIGIAVAVRGGAGYYSHHDEIIAALKHEGYGWLVPTAP